jgi:hypothetical protein
MNYDNRIVTACYAEFLSLEIKQALFAPPRNPLVKLSL